MQINFAKREVQCKVVYYGPAESGKTANLRAIHAHAPPNVRGTLTTIATDTNRTLFFDFLPLDLGLVAGIRTKVHLYAVPYIENQNAVRVLVLEGVDGVVFVADSARARLARNVEALENLQENLANLGRELSDLPLIFQWNKSDLPDAMPAEELDKSLNPAGHPSFVAVADAGNGVFSALKALTQAVLVNVSNMMGAQTAAPPTPAPAAPAAPAPAPVAQPRPTPVAPPAPVPEPAPVRVPVPEPAPLPAAPQPVPAMASIAAPQQTQPSTSDFEEVALPTPEPEPAAPAAAITDEFEPMHPSDPDTAEVEPFADDREPTFTPPWRTETPQRKKPEEPAFEEPPPSPELAASVPQAMPGPSAPAMPSGYESAEQISEPAPLGWDEPAAPAKIDGQAVRPARGRYRNSWDAPETIGGHQQRGDARPVVDRRRHPRPKGGARTQTIPAASVAAGAIFALISLIAIGYAVYALL